MPDDLYWADTLLWSQQQAALLRRLAAGERVNDVDWAHVIEEIDDVGKTALRACESLLRRAIEHLLKIALYPDHAATRRWRAETLAFLSDARRAFAPSMRQKINLPDLYAEAREIVAQAEYGPTLLMPPDHCPLALDDLLSGRTDLDRLSVLFSRSFTA